MEQERLVNQSPERQYPHQEPSEELDLSQDNLDMDGHSALYDIGLLNEQ